MFRLLRAKLTILYTGLSAFVLLSICGAIALAPALAQFRPLLVPILGAGLLGLVLLAIGSWLLTRNFLKPAAALDAAMQRLAGGEDAAVAAASDDEIGRLAHSFNVMAAAIGARERRTMHLALHDPETDLPNRLAFERAVAVLQNSCPNHHLVVLAAVGIDRFHRIRGAIGYALAGELMSGIGARVSVLFPNRPVGRLASDVLGMAFYAANIEDARRLAEDMVSAIEAPCYVQGNAIDVNITVGLAALTVHADDVAGAVERATVALDQARAKRSKLAVFDRIAYGDPAGNLSLITDMLESIAQGQMMLHLQPKYDLRLGRITGVEALVRWNHPKRGTVLPGLFIGMAEETGHIDTLTEWVLRRAIAERAVLKRAGYDLTVSVNMSGRLMSDLAFAERTRAMIVASGADICLEITETAMIENSDLAMQIIADYAAAGIGISIDDYGSGLSSLAYLKTIRANELKIDKSFILSLSEGQKDALLVKSTVDLAHSLGLKVTAEGVETPEALALLTTMGCDVAQGYFIAKPMPLDALLTFLDTNPAAGFARMRAGTPAIAGLV